MTNEKPTGMMTFEEHKRKVEKVELQDKVGSRNYQQLLDHFASIALPARLASLHGVWMAEEGWDWPGYCKLAAEQAYDIAEAMLKEREARK